MSSTPERGGAAFGALMAERVRELELEQGEAISPARLTRMVFAHLVDQDRQYDQQQTQRVLDRTRAYPDAEEVHAWCGAVGFAGKRLVLGGTMTGDQARARAFWVCGLVPPEVTPEQLAAAMEGGAPKSVIRRHLSTPIRAGATTTGRRGRAGMQARSGKATYAFLAGHGMANSDLSALLHRGEWARPAA